MNIIATFYAWLTPSILFEFIKPRAPDECATLLATRSGARSGPFFQRLRVEVTSDPDGYSYSFLVNPRTGGYFIIEARGTISTLTDAYSQIEGSARTRPTLMALATFSFGLAIYCAIMIAIIFALFATNTFSSSLIPACVLVVMLIASSFMSIRFQKWIMEMYSDMVLGFILRNL